jgi:Domain of unknown function (DUF4335)
MSIRREYRSPNCTLILEGFGENSSIFDNNVGTFPLLSILINAECHFIGVNNKLQGGRVFLENLAQTVSSYTQQCLSGIIHPETNAIKEGERITLESLPSSHLHRLTWYPPIELQQEPVILELSTVQLFDLVETLDQFLGDVQTLPDLSFKLQPLSRNYRRATEEPTLQKVLPAVLGAASLGITAFAIYLLPIPTVRKPVEAKPQVTPSGVTVPTQPTRVPPSH